MRSAAISRSLPFIVIIALLSTGLRPSPILAAAPDLTPTAFTAPASANAGQPVTISWTVQNIGDAQANPSWQDRVFLSDDDVFNTGDTLIIALSHTTALAAGVSYTETRVVTLSSTTTAGAKFLLFQTDAGTVAESDEANNLVARPIDVLKADLVPVTLTAPPMVSSDTTFTVSWTVENQGTGTASPSWTDQIFLSDDTVIGGGDITLTSMPISITLGAGTSSSRSFTILMPAFATGGAKYLILWTDRFNQIPEVSDANNTLAIPITVLKPDLAPVDLLTPSSAQAGASFTVTWEVTNQGDGEAASPWNDRVYFSNDTTLTPGIDPLLRDIAHSTPLSAGASYTQSGAITIPTTASNGLRYLILATDVALAVNESDEANNLIVVAITIGNSGPSANANGPYAVAEGDTVTLTGTGADPDGNELVFSWDLDNDGAFETAGASLTYSAAGRNGPDSQTVVLQVCDSLGACATNTTSIAITNVVPSVTITGSPATSLEGSVVSLGATVDDPGTNETLTYSWDAFKHGDAFATGSGTTFAFTPDDNAIYDIALVVNDGNGDGSNMMTITVENVAPAVGAITAPMDPMPVGTTVVASAGFADPGEADTHSAVWDWGDGTMSAGSVTESGGAGSVTDSHTYTAPGVYTVSLTVTDDDGGNASSIFQYVVIYDPNGGFVTGGGWIDSPAGAYAPDPTLTGRANFGFHSKYLKGATVPTGNTQFKFSTADLDFTSTTYQWLVIAGARAQFKGSGTLNGAGDYGFILTAIDGQVSGGGGQDRFRIKIWDTLTGDIVYDNQMGDSDTAAPATGLGGGSIRIHTMN